MATAGEPTRYAVLLRAVNVGGTGKITMADLRALLTGLGHADVATHLQSGNAVLTAPAGDPDALGAGIEAALAAQLGLTSRVLVLTHADLAQVVARNPFPTAEESPSTHLVQFLFDRPDAAARTKITSFDATPFAPEEYSLGERVVYLRLPGGAGRSALAVAFSRHVTARTVMTGRNWNTVRKLTELTAV